jgi:hypothetical protein
MGSDAVEIASGIVVWNLKGDVEKQYPLAVG